MSVWSRSDRQTDSTYSKPTDCKPFGVMLVFVRFGSVWFRFRRFDWVIIAKNLSVSSRVGVGFAVWLRNHTRVTQHNNRPTTHRPNKTLHFPEWQRHSRFGVGWESVLQCDWGIITESHQRDNRPTTDRTKPYIFPRMAETKSVWSRIWIGFSMWLRCIKEGTHSKPVLRRGF